MTQATTVYTVQVLPTVLSGGSVHPQEPATHLVAFPTGTQAREFAQWCRDHGYCPVVDWLEVFDRTEDAQRAVQGDV